jgi:hypothetical protein
LSEKAEDIAFQFSPEMSIRPYRFGLAELAEAVALVRMGLRSGWATLDSLMQTQEITIRVDPEAANAYLAASDEDRRKLDLLLSLRLQDVTQSAESLEDVMREISRRAQQRGLTPEILDSILRDE